MRRFKLDIACCLYQMIFKNSYPVIANFWKIHGNGFLNKCGNHVNWFVTKYSCVIVWAGPPSDEMEMLYLHLKQASLSPTGALQPTTKRDFRSSFIRRCKNESVNEKLHLIRALNSTLKVSLTLVCLFIELHG